MKSSLAEQISSLTAGDHLCLIYENRDEQMAAVAPFMAQGLDRGEACVYIADDLAVEEARAALGRAGIDVESSEESGALQFATKRDAYLRSGSFDPEAMTAFLVELGLAAVAKGFRGLRVTGEMTWALGGECGCDRLIEYEALLNDHIPGSRMTVICQYSRSRFSPEIIRDVLRTHPIAILGDQVCKNLYYESPRMVLGQESAEGKVSWMIEQLQKFRTTERTLEEAVRSRDEFLSIASHELNTPLTSLRLQVQNSIRAIEKDEASQIPREQVLRILRMAERQTDRLVKLVSDLLDVSRIQSGKLSLELEPLDLREVLYSVRERFELQAEDAGCPIEVDANCSIEGLWDRCRMEQTVMNLIGNAIKYAPGEPVSLRLERRDGRARLTVKDSGIGIAEQDRGRIFERFERAVSSRNVSGLGLGLYITRQMVEAHGGTIEVDSRVGHGSTFSVELPIRQLAA